MNMPLDGIHPIDTDPLSLDDERPSLDATNAYAVKGARLLLANLGIEP